LHQTLQLRKQKLVHDAIYEAAIDLFAERSFEEVTVEEVALAAGVSRRTFFRYFASKDDLLAQSVVDYGAVLAASITSCPAAAKPLEVVQQTIQAAIKCNEGQHRMRKIVDIAARSAGARQAYTSRMVEVEETVARAFAERFKSTSHNNLRPRLFAGFTLLIMNVAISSWYSNEYPDLASGAKQAFANLSRVFCDSAANVVKVESVPRKRASDKR
jgi:AcrR family transcriptional regulator